MAVTATPPDRGAQYHELFRFVYPYLCDPERLVAARFGLHAGPAKIVGTVKAILKDAPGHLREFRQQDAVLSGKLAVSPESEKSASQSFVPDAFFIVDKRGIVRYASSGNGLSLLPSNAEIARRLSAL